MNAALPADVFTKHDDFRIAIELRAQRAPHGIRKAQHLAFFGGRFRAERADLFRAQAAHRGCVAGPGNLRVHKALDLVRNRGRAGARSRERGANIARNFALERFPILV